MRINLAITGGPGLLGAALARVLGDAYSVRVAPEGDLCDETFARQVVAGCQALIHLAPLYPDLPASARARQVLDRATRGTYALLRAAVAADVERVILGSTLALLERYPPGWAVGEAWQPRPDVTDLAQLAAYLAEESARQFAFAGPLTVICLRLGEVVEDQAIQGRRYDPRWLHVDDAVQAVRSALHRPPAAGPHGHAGTMGARWHVYHIAGGGAYTRVPLAAARGADELGYTPTHTFAHVPGADEPPPAPTMAELDGDLSLLGPRERIPSRPIRNVVIFGAGGPLAAAATPMLAATYRLRLADLRDIADIVAENRPQAPGAPLPQALEPPHETMQVDVTDLDQVWRACEGMDAVINCTVNREHPINAFLVNALGAYNVMAAAVAHKIRRVVHAGPQLVAHRWPAGYRGDFGVPDDAPPRPGTWLYSHTKYLGQEIVRLFAEAYDLEAPTLLLTSLVNPETAAAHPGGVHPMSISWEDAGLAVRRALETPDLPSPFERLHILADLPHGTYSAAKARRLLGWCPRDNLAHLWARPS
jgi:nucleoside-diphosphate-sugar epimerase